MSLAQSFCPSPWFHMRINNAGCYEYCRWTPIGNKTTTTSIVAISPEQFFQKNMSDIRASMIAGEKLPGCVDCYTMEKHNKVSGRQRQLLKIGVTVDNFANTMLSSPWINQCSEENINLFPQDWQIDLGNYCNSACVFCSPDSSSRLAHEFKKLKIIDSSPPRNWCDDPQLLTKFINTLKKSPVLKYLHFIGGETLITPAFATILRELIKSNLHHDISIGFTTNLTVWDDNICELLTQFKEVNLGLSIECFDKLNDYVRWPSDIASVTTLVEKWLKFADKYQWPVQFRTTPTWLTVGKLLSVYDYAWKHNVAVESCNFLENPEFLRISVLPKQHRDLIIAEMQQWLDTHRLDQKQIINTRNLATLKVQVTQDLSSYVNYLKNEIDESFRLPAAVQYLKLLESNRKNSILQYLPEYENLFRSAGY